MKELTNLLITGMVLGSSLIGCDSGKSYDFYPGGKKIQVKTEKSLSVNKEGMGLVKINGKLYVKCNEEDQIFITDFGENGNPILVEEEDGTYGVIVENEKIKSYYDWDKKGNSVKKHYVK